MTTDSTEQKIWQATSEIEIPFHDVDSMHIVWHGHYLKYFEIARCALLDVLNYNYRQMHDSGYAWPVVKSNLKYIRPARFGDTVLVTATIKEFRNRIVMDYEIRNKASNELLTRGSTTQVCVEIASGEMLFRVPDELLRSIGLIA